jgi:hypothetical protein
MTSLERLLLVALDFAGSLGRWMRENTELIREKIFFGRSQSIPSTHFESRLDFF